MMRRRPRSPLFPYTTLFRSGSAGAGRPSQARRFCPPLHSGRPRSARPPYVAQRRAKPWEKLEKPKIFRCSSHGFLFSPCSVITTRRSVSSMLARRGREFVFFAHFARGRKNLPKSYRGRNDGRRKGVRQFPLQVSANRSEEHTSELQSPCNLVCR